MSMVVKAVPNSAIGLPLTAENIESVMDKIRPYLISDGGNTSLHEIDGNYSALNCPCQTEVEKRGEKLFDSKSCINIKVIHI
ncbi:hypothetical protein P3L10_001225 [Capsicum annuum]